MKLVEIRRLRQKDKGNKGKSIIDNHIGGIGMYKIDTWYRGMSIMSAKKVVRNGYFNHKNSIRQGEDRIFFTPLLEVAKAYALQNKKYGNDEGIVFECGIVGEILYSESPLLEYFYTKDKVIGTDIIKKIHLVERIGNEKKIIRELSKEELLNLEDIIDKKGTKLEKYKNDNNFNTNEEIFNIIAPAHFQCPNINKIIDKINDKYIENDLEGIRQAIKDLRKWGQSWKDIAKYVINNTDININDIKNGGIE